MAKYLDQTGLTYFWGKVKGWVNNSQHPVGSIYISTSSTFEPAKTWGGTWRKTADGRCLIGANETYPLGSTGGAETHTHSADNMYAELGPYGNGFAMVPVHTNSPWESESLYTVSTVSKNAKLIYYGTAVTGDTTESTNMQPYLAVYIWERTA